MYSSIMRQILYIFFPIKKATNRRRKKWRSLGVCHWLQDEMIWYVWDWETHSSLMSLLAKVRNCLPWEVKRKVAEDTWKLGESRKSLWNAVGYGRAREYTDWSDSSPVTVTKYSSLQRWFSKKSAKTKVALLEVHCQARQLILIQSFFSKPHAHRWAVSGSFLKSFDIKLIRFNRLKLALHWTMRPKSLIKPGTSCIREGCRPVKELNLYFGVLNATSSLALSTLSHWKFKDVHSWFLWMDPHSGKW